MLSVSSGNMEPTFPTKRLSLRLRLRLVPGRGTARAEGAQWRVFLLSGDCIT